MELPEDLPPEARAVVESYFLSLEARVARLDSAYHERFATVLWSDGGALLEEYVLARFTAVSEAFPLSSFPAHLLQDATDKYLEGLACGVKEALDFASHALRAFPEHLRHEAHSRISLKLSARSLAFQAAAKQYLADTPHTMGRPATGLAEVQRPPSDLLVERRRLAVRRYRDDHDVDAVGFARRVGISESGITGIIREDWSRFSRSTQEKLLAIIGMTREDWYRE
jgi:hypothetical protein